MSSVAEVDAIAERLYTSPDAATRQAAHEQLAQLTGEGADITALFAVLSQSTSQYTLLFLAQGLVAWMKANSATLTREQRLELIVTHCGDCLKRLCLGDAPRHVLLAMLTAYAKMTKLSFEKEPYLVEAVDVPLGLLFEYHSSSGSSAGMDPRLRYLAVLLLDALVTEFCRYDSSKSKSFMNFSIHRRCSNNFRDERCLEVFKASLRELREVNSAHPLVADVVSLVKNCLQFDFMAIMVDETEDALSAQFPSAWRDTLLASETSDLLWGQHAALPYPLCVELLTGITALCGMRRTFFDAAEDRVRYLDDLLGRLVDTAGLTDGRLSNPHYVTVYGEACARFIAPFGYRDLHQSSRFEAWVRAVKAISMDVFHIPFGQDGSFTTATTLLSFWSRLATSKRMYMCGDGLTPDVELLVPDLCQSFFQSRVNLDGAGGSGSGGGGPSNNQAGGGGGGGNYVLEEDDDYESAMDAILTQADAFASMALLQPARTLEPIATYLNQSLGPSILNKPSAVAWLFFLAGSLVRHVLSNVEEESVVPCSNFFLFCVDAARHRQAASTQPGVATGPGTIHGNAVEQGLLHFLTTVQSVLTGPRLHSQLSQVVTNIFQSRGQLFQFMLTTTGHNLMRAGEDEVTVEIMRASIDLIGEACRDVSPAILSELSFDLPPIADLPLAQSARTYKLRTNLMAVLWPLSCRSRPSAEALARYVAPLQRYIEQTTMDPAASGSPSFVAGWMRDLRGAARALYDSGEVFGDFVEWFCGNASAFHAILAGPAGESPMVVVSFLRVMLEMVASRRGRYCIPGGPHSTAGLLLFKHLSAFIQQIIERCVTEERIHSLTSGGSVDGIYLVMLKPLALSMMCLRDCISGGFVPFGAMWFYEDETYDNTLLGLLRMLPVFPAHYFQDYRKVSHAVLDLLRTVAGDHVYQPLAKLSTTELEAVILFVVRQCEDVDVTTGALLHGLTFLSFVAGLVKEVKELSTGTPAGGPSDPSHSTTPPPPPLQLPHFYAMPALNMPGAIGRVSGTPGGAVPGRYLPSARVMRQAVAARLEPVQSLWLRLIHVAMNIIVCQDRALSVSCGVVYPIFEAHPPFWHEFVDGFVLTYPARKQQAVREALSELSNAADSQDRFFSEIFTFRQKLRVL